MNANPTITNTVRVHDVVQATCGKGSARPTEDWTKPEIVFGVARLKRISVGSASHIGMVRSENQDSFGKSPDQMNDLSSAKGQLFVIADGMGGHAGGKQASSLAVETIVRSYAACTKNSVTDCLKHAFKEANSAIYEYSIHHPQFIGMGTTCIALVLHGNVASFAHVGDSRLYKITTSAIEQLTHDHTKVAELLRRGLLTEEEVEAHPERSMLYRAMGVQTTMQFDVVDGMELSSNEYFLLCTDGLSNLVAKEEIKEIVLSHPSQGACEMLVELANRRGGYDNITVQVVHVKGEDSFLKKILR